MVTSGISKEVTMHNTKDTTNHLKRHAEETVRRLSRTFGSVLVTGPEEAGKTTLLRSVAPGASYITLDDPTSLFSAAERDHHFFRNNPPPVFIDKIQYAPFLLGQISDILDRSRQKGLFLLCSSRQLPLNEYDLQPTGKIALFHLLGLSLREKFSISFSEAFLPTDDYLAAHKAALLPVSRQNIWGFIHHGSMPGLADCDAGSWQRFYASYVKRYIERDVHDFIRLEDSIKFLHFMACAARRTGRPLNLSSMARECGVSQTTGKRWINILENYHIVYLLKPFSKCGAKRTVKSPKLYYLDTGLAAYLTGWHSPHEMKSGPMANVFFENFVITEILKSYYNKGISEPPLYFCRAKGMHEITLLIQDGRTVYPLVIKWTDTPCRKDITAFSLLDGIPGTRRGCGGIICQYDHLAPLKDNDKIIPVSYL